LRQHSWFFALWAWFDSDAGERKLESKRFTLWRAIPFILVHLGCFGVYWVGVSKSAILAAVILYYLRMFCITGFYHRYFSHKTFKMNRFWQFIFALLGATSGQRGPLWWASHHRCHHRHADTEQDPHSPHHAGFIWSHIGWFFSPDAFTTDYKAVSDLTKFRELKWLNRYDIVAPLLLIVSLYALGQYWYYYAPELQTSGLQLVVWGFFISTVFVFHATSSINSLSHQWGTRDFDTPDESRNNLWLALITLGEGWHNNHHFYSNSTRQGFRWWQIDITFYMLWFLSKIGIIHELRPVDMKRGKLR
jgi:stearoyl-CoA desaturase (delta-9 desaturase)